jgi:hypothetical protein
MLNRPASSKEPDEPSHFAHAGPPPNPPRAPALAHRQAREQLALLLDETTELTLRAALEKHVARCAECAQELEQLRQAEAWLVEQPREAPEMVALEGATWAAIQERLAPQPRQEWAALKAMLSQQEPALAEIQPEERCLVSAGGIGGEPETSDSPQSLPAPISPSPTVPALPSPTRLWLIKPQQVLVAVLAASFVMTSMAALFLAYLTKHPAPASTASSQTLPLADVLDPGNLTTALTFDPDSHALFVLTSDQRVDCPRGMHCPLLAPCLKVARLDLESSRRADALLPKCATNANASGAGSFADLLEDRALSRVVAVTLDQQVMTYNSRDNRPAARYHLACCDDASQPLATFLDQRDHLLLTPTVSDGADQTLHSLTAQDVRNGQVAYQVALSSADMRPDVVPAGLFSEVTGWLYLWTNCATIVSGLCVEVYEGKSGKEVTAWKVLPDETPLAADPAQEVLYVRHDEDNGQSETLALDARTGAVRGQLPGAAALAVNQKLHHAYLLNKAGVSVADTQSWQVLSTLPVLAHDEGWTAPEVDVQADRVYVPTILGKVLKVQDTPAGRLSLSSPEEQAVLNVDRVMENSMDQGRNGLDPWQLPLGPGSTSLNYTVWQKTDDGAAAYAVPGRLQTTVARLNGGDYSVLIALSWSHTSSALESFTSTPFLLPSYPYQHTWRYQVPSTGDAMLSEEHGDPLARCC